MTNHPRKTIWCWLGIHSWQTSTFGAIVVSRCVNCWKIETSRTDDVDREVPWFKH